MKPPEVKRRCGRRHCPHWMVVDPFDPAAADQRYCSPACEERDLLEAAHAGQLTLDEAVEFALVRLRIVLRDPRRLSAALEASPVSKHRTRFLWLDCVSHTRGDLITVPEADAEPVIQALIDELNDWRKGGRHSAISDERKAKAKGAVA